MLVLVVDSSTPAVTAGLARITADEVRLLAERRTVDARAHGELLAPHLEAALALWQYAEDSARFIFGDATGDPNADRVLAALRANGPMAQGELVDLFGRHVAGARLTRALEALVSAGLVRSSRVETGGRPRTVWEAV